MSSNGYIYHRLSPCEENEYDIRERSISGGFKGGREALYGLADLGV